ncbi:hypothetical protein PMKS-003264 [Pichia membranifaciens]|uniref:Uncharacterized protein n=1 Tax=Pichia membranifaciens TaxID=4926 RepID=A0A1Q2YJP5_9ASCO|nr:hypothetical protein PMKS-003264 [Pichia membranifaciens]
MNSDPTDISSDVETTAVETDTFDKQELIVWASKLELESIDYRTTSIDLLEKLSKLSKLLTESLGSVKTQIFEMKINGSEKDRKLKNFIELTVAGEVDEVYNRISQINNKIKELQTSIHAFEDIDLEAIESKFNAFLKIQNKKNKEYEEQLQTLRLILDQATKQNPLRLAPSCEITTEIGAEKVSQKCKPRRPGKVDGKSNVPARRSYSSKRPDPKVIKHSQQRRTSTFTRKLIFD